MDIPEEHLALLQRSLTRKEYEEMFPFFKENYSKNFQVKSKKQANSGSKVLDTAFNWHRTTQGHRYWSSIYVTMRKRENSAKS